jgi:alpha-tubulin suppressor-like RCC1 family protein
MPVNTRHALVLDENEERMFGIGSNVEGELGTGDATPFTQFTAIATPVKFQNLALGSYHTLAISNCGELWGWGENDFGQAGLGINVSKAYIPTKVPVETKVSFSSIACGGYFSVALDTNGFIWTVGDNKFGQLGLGLTPEVAHSLIRNPSLSNIQMISTGYFTVLHLDSDGNIFGHGNNAFGQLSATGSNSKVTIPTKVQCDVPFVMIAAGVSFSLALDVFGNVWGCGSNSFGALGPLPAYTSHFCKIEGLENCSFVGASSDASFIRDNNNQVLGMGSNQYNLFNISTNNDRLRTPTPMPHLCGKPLIIGGSYVLTRDENGFLECYGEVNTPLEKSVPITSVQFSTSRRLVKKAIF